MKRTFSQAKKKLRQRKTEKSIRGGQTGGRLSYISDNSFGVLRFVFVHRIIKAINKYKRQTLVENNRIRKMADVESSAVVQQPPTGASSMSLNSIPLLASGELLGESSSAQVNLQQQQQQSQPVAGAVGGGNSGSAGTSSSSANNAGSTALDTASSENTNLVNSGVIGSGVGGGSNSSNVAGGKMDSGEPPAKKQMLDHPSTSAGSGNSASQHEKLEYRLGGILCCAVCLDLPKTAMYQVSTEQFYAKL